MSKTKVDEIYLQLKRDILSLKYDVGDALYEQHIANQFMTSKTPVREALSLLVQEGCLVKYPRRGYFVKEVNLKEYYELTQYRFMTEVSIARYIIAKCSDEQIASLFVFTPPISTSFDSFPEENYKFHIAMAEITGNRYFVAAIRKIFQLNVRQMAVDGYNKLRNDIHLNHRNLVYALQKRDIKKAEEILAEDIRRSDELNDQLVY